MLHLVFVLVCGIGTALGGVLALCGGLAAILRANRGVDLSSVGGSDGRLQVPYALPFGMGVILVVLGVVILRDAANQLAYQAYSPGDTITWDGKEAKIVALSNGALEIRLPDNTVTKIRAAEIKRDEKK